MREKDPSALEQYEQYPLPDVTVISRANHGNNSERPRRKKKRRARRAGPPRRALKSRVRSRESVEDGEPGYCSRSEQICAALLARFVPGFEVVTGETFQVPIGRDRQGNTLAVDFMVNGVLFEYHPVRFWRKRRKVGDFRDLDEYRDYERTYYSLTKDRRPFLQELMKKQLSENYFMKRRLVLDQHPKYRTVELVVAHGPEDFYWKVIRRFGRKVPKSENAFLDMFRELQKSLP